MRPFAEGIALAGIFSIDTVSFFFNIFLKYFFIFLKYVFLPILKAQDSLFFSLARSKMISSSSLSVQINSFLFSFKNVIIAKALIRLFQSKKP